MDIKKLSQTPHLPGGRNGTCKVPGPKADTKIPPVHTPATDRFHIIRIFDTMRKNPTKGDWASSAIKLVEKYLNLNLKEIQDMQTSIYKKLVKRQMHTIAFKELLEIQKSKEKGKLIKYDNL